MDARLRLPSTSSNNRRRLNNKRNRLPSNRSLTVDTRSLSHRRLTCIQAGIRRTGTHRMGRTSGISMGEGTRQARMRALLHLRRLMRRNGVHPHPSRCRGARRRLHPRHHRARLTRMRGMGRQGAGVWKTVGAHPRRDETGYSLRLCARARAHLRRRITVEVRMGVIARLDEDRNTAPRRAVWGWRGAGVGGVVGRGAGRRTR